MLKISQEALDFSLAHIIAKGDTDIFPLALEYQTIQDQWSNVREYLQSQDLDLWAVRPARTCLAPKRDLGFRVATQLDPINTLLITALVYEIAADLEKARVPATHVSA